MEVDLRAHRARAALGDAVARSRRRCSSARSGSCAALAEWRGAPPRGDAARMEVAARRSSTAAGSSRSRCSRARRTHVAADLFNLTVLHPARAGRGAGRGARRRVAARRGVDAGRAAGRRLRAAGSRGRRRCSAVECAQRVGKLQRARRDPAQLAAGAAAAGARRVRRRARSRAPGRAQPLAALLGARRDA